jgi:hypothetical protein
MGHQFFLYRKEIVVFGIWRNRIGVKRIKRTQEEHKKKRERNLRVSKERKHHHHQKEN